MREQAGVMVGHRKREQTGRQGRSAFIDIMTGRGVFEVWTSRDRLPPIKLHYYTWICVFPCRWDHSVSVLPVGQHVQSTSHPPACSVPSNLPNQHGRCSRSPAALLHHSTSPLFLHPGGPRALACKLPALITHPYTHRHHQQQHHHGPPSCVNPAAFSPQSRDHANQGSVPAAFSGQPCFSRKSSSAPLCQDWVWQPSRDSQPLPLWLLPHTILTLCLCERACLWSICLTVCVSVFHLYHY